jgi:hypothetical protein|tara:strand:- start:23975 stop:24520 length:546 start_codon:yes stop_codon:yes gene_type:complete
MKKALKAGLILLLVTLFGCGSAGIKDVIIEQPKLVPEQFFDGDLTASGVVKNRSGQVIRSFTAAIKAYWIDGVGTLEEDFVFNNGETQRRVWTLTPRPDGSYTGTADDVTGSAIIEVAGNQMILDYVLQVPYKDGTLDIRIDDRMYLVEEGLLLNESRMTKFGFTVGYILLSITQNNPPSP